MRRFSRLFWFTTLAGGVSSLLLTCAVLWFFTAQSDATLVLCRQGKPGCGTSELLQHLYRAACAVQAGGTILLFGLAYRLGRAFIKPAAAAARAAGQ